MPYVTSVQAGPDLDGDGTPDQIVVVEQMRVISARLYAMRGTCGHFVGDLGAPPEKVANTMRSHGLIDLLSLDQLQRRALRLHPGPDVVPVRRHRVSARHEGVDAEPRPPVPSTVA